MGALWPILAKAMWGAWQIGPKWWTYFGDNLWLAWMYEHLGPIWP